MYEIFRHHPLIEAQNLIITKCMGSNTEFQKLLAQMSIYLDNEMSSESGKELMDKIQENPEYLQLLSKEKHFREFVKSRLQRKKVSPSLVDSIKNRIKT